MDHAARDGPAGRTPQDQPLHVLVVSRLYPSADQPSRGTFVADLVRALADAGHLVVVASFETVQVRGPEATRAARAGIAAAAWAGAVSRADVLNRPRSWGAGVPVARLPVIRTWGQGAGFDEADQVDRHAAVLFPFGRALARRASIDVIHAHCGAPDGLAAARLASELGVPLLVSEHDSTLPRRLAADRRLAAEYRNLADPGAGAESDRRRIVAVVSPVFADRIRTAIGSDVPLEVLPNPIALNAFGASEPPERDPDELLWVGMLADHKGTPLLFSAFAEVLRRRPRFRLRLIGPSADGDVDRWRELAGTLQIADALTFEPQASRAAVAAGMRRASIFVHPSPWETFGVVAAEAIASGLPVAATPSGGVEWIVGRDGRLGEIATGHDPTSLADAIVAVDERRSSFDPKAMRVAMSERFAPDRVAALTSALYRRVLADASLRSILPDVRPLEPLADGGTANGRPPLVIGLHPSVLARLIALPVGVLAGPTVVTGPGPFVRADDPPPRRFELDPAEAYRRRLAATGGLLRRLRRHQLVDARGTIEASAVRQVLALAADAHRGSDPGPVRVVAVDADDAVAVLDALGDGAVLAPGSLRWLADRQDAADDPAGPG